MYLNNHTYFSLRYGVLKPRELLELMQGMGVRTLALTDINNTSGGLEFVRQALLYKIKPILGIDFRNGVEPNFVALAKNNAGFQELNDYLSYYLEKEKDFPAQAPEFAHAYVIYPFSKPPDRLRNNEFVGISMQQIPQLYISEWAHRLSELVVLQPVTFRDQRDFNTHRLLRAIALNTLLSKLPKSEEANKEDKPVNPEDIHNAFAEFPEILYNTQAILDNCSIYFEFGDQFPHKNQKTYTGSEKKDYELVKILCHKTVRQRYPNPGKNIFKRIEKELNIIRQKGALAYFLINWDIIEYARSKNYAYVGRGSGANSIVAYLLRITDVDPVELDLYFERFINLYRKNPPDFDIDFSWLDRDDITEYIFKRFKNVALLATYNTFQHRAAIRELGKVFGLPKHEIDKLLKHNPNPEPLDKLSQLVLYYGSRIQDFPNHLSVHASGIIITEKPVHYFTATFFPPKGFVTTHIDMESAEDAGVHKFDILSQRGLSKIQEALEVIRYNQPTLPEIDIHNLEMCKKDEEVKSLLKNGEAIGCFYVESPAMRMLLKKLEVDTYLGLVAASSIIRPGVAKSGMMREYIYRFRHPETIKQRAHPVLLELMPDTYGVMVYQEDVIKVAHHFAGLTLGEADHLRRGMSGKFRSREEFLKTKDQFFNNCRARNIPETETAEIWRQIESFAGYAFAKGHSASYAVESYQCLYLKAHFPLEYMVAVINNGGGFYRPEIYIHEARMCGAVIESPCINNSTHEATINGTAIRLGLNMVRELEHQAIKQILRNRQLYGPFSTLSEFLHRVPISLEQVKPLIRVGALRFTGKDKKSLLWEAHFLLGDKKQTFTSGELFNAPTTHLDLPTFVTDNLEDAYDQIELLGFTLRSPFELLEELPEATIMVQEMEQSIGKTVTMIGYYVHRKNVHASNNKRMHFGTFLDKDGHFIDTVHFPDVAKKYPFRGPGIYAIKGKIVEEFKYVSLEVIAMKKLAMQTLESDQYLKTMSKQT
ncbi:MAG: DNA polymerase III subunit alpha, partial [Bacteroidota bacterium]